MSIKNFPLVFTMLIVLVISIAISATSGAMHISTEELLDILFSRTSADGLQMKANVFWQIRLPRVCLGALVGAGLAISGAALQGVFRNQLADPGLIGISSGAAFSAVIVIVAVANFQHIPFVASLNGFYLLPVTTFIGALITSWIVYTFSKANGKVVVSTLLLTGIAMNALSGSLTGILTYTATDAQLRNITFWSMGSLGGASWETVTHILPFIVLPCIGLPYFARALNVFALGEDEAHAIGVPVQLLKTLVLVFSTMAVGASVALCGIIGFIGLVVPHVIRISFGSDHSRVLPLSALGGAIILTLADLIARTIVSPAELPIGIVTALLGTPVFITILWKEKRKNEL